MIELSQGGFVLQPLPETRSRSRNRLVARRITSTLLVGERAEPLQE